MKWISVKDKLPAIGESVLAYHATDFAVAAYFDKVTSWGTEYENVWLIDHQDNIEVMLPTHWMPLPEPPKL